MRPKFLVLASGRGSNFDSIHGVWKQSGLPGTLTGVLSDQPKAPVLEKASGLGLRTALVSKEKGETADQYGQKLLTKIDEFAPDWLVLAGFMRILPDPVIHAFRSPRGYHRIVNVHPSLLPAFPGVNSYAQAFNYGAKVAGVSVHLVVSEVDQGPICAQEAFTISDLKSAAEVEARGLAVEHRLYPATLRWVLAEQFETVMRGGRICVCPS